MKKNKLILLCASVMLVSALTSCMKSVERINSNTTNVTFASSGPKYVTQNVTVNPGDSIQFNYTVTCPTNMKFIAILKNDTPLSTDTIKTGSQISFSAIKKFVADVAPGVYNYKVVAKDAGGIYLGSQNLVVTVMSDFNYFTAIKLAVPDTVAKINPCYYSTTANQTYSYSTAAANSAKIDMGYYFDSDTVLVGTTKVVNGHTIYALNISPVPNFVNFYDISAFTKNATLLKIPATTIVFQGATVSLSFAALTSGALIQAVGAATFTSGAVTKLNHLSTSSSTSTTAPATNFFMFKTAAGKYGAVAITYTNQNFTRASTYMNIEVKVQK